MNCCDPCAAKRQTWPGCLRLNSRRWQKPKPVVAALTLSEEQFIEIICYFYSKTAATRKKEVLTLPSKDLLHCNLTSSLSWSNLKYTIATYTSHDFKLGSWVDHCWWVSQNQLLWWDHLAGSIPVTGKLDEMMNQLHDLMVHYGSLWFNNKNDQGLDHEMTLQAKTSKHTITQQDLKHQCWIRFASRFKARFSLRSQIWHCDRLAKAVGK